MPALVRSKQSAPPPEWPADQVERRAVAVLIPYARNARTHSPEQIAQIAASIREWGWTMPVLVDEAGTIIAGHARVLAAQRLGLPDIPVMVARGWSEAKIKAYVIADNRLAENAGWDDQLLRIEVGDLASSGFDLALLGFGEAELDDLLGESGSGEDIYSGKIAAPIYIPSDDVPPVSELCDRTKTDTLIEEIYAADIPYDVRAFLAIAAERHTVFDFHRIADFYAHAPAATQRLMERSALVIVDVDTAIENGWVKLNEHLRDLAAAMPNRKQSTE